jgi:protease IV
MKQFLKMFFASFFAMIVAGVVVTGLIIAMIVGSISKATSSKKELTNVKNNSVLVIDMSDKYHEQREESSFSFLGSESSSVGLYEMTRCLSAAANDSKISGVLLKLAPSPNSWATLQQLRLALTQFKQSGKFIYAYGESITQGAFYIASVADSIFLNPAGDIELKGLSSQVYFYKNALAKLEVEPEIFYAGKFKSATEPFRADKISEPNRVQIAALQSGIWSEFLTAIAQHSHSDTSTINALARAGSIQFPIDALNNKLIDGVRYWDEVESIIQHKLGVSNAKDISYTSMDDYSNSNAITNKTKDQRIAVLFAEGDIADGTQSKDYEIASEDMAKTIVKLRENDKIKAVVLRINSPGGSARASEIILRELQLLRKKKPLIVSMGDVAASGGYYIACQADSIFAMPNTITGSIGVFSMMFSTEKLMSNKLGITSDQVKNAPFADFPNGSRIMNADEAKMMQRGVDTIYSVFKRRVAVGRRISETDVDSIAQGRVWTGRDAMRIGLVDGMGNLDRAIHSAATLAKLSDYQVTTYPEPVDKMKTIMKMIKSNSSASVAVSKAIQEEIGMGYDEIIRLQNLKKMNGRALMLLPFNVSTK